MGEVEEIRSRLLLGEDLNQIDWGGKTLLHFACSHGHKEVVSLLIEKGANIEANDKKQLIPLFNACTEGHKEVVELLLEKGASIEVLNEVLFKTSANGHKEVVSLLLEKGANVEARDNFSNQTPLLNACVQGNKEIVSLLIEKGANIEAKDYFDRTPLFKACSEGHKEIVSLLLEEGANFEAKAENNWTPLFYACDGGHKEVVSLLIEKGANIEARDKNNRNALFKACDGGHKEVVSLLIEKGANIESEDKYSHRTALFEACHGGHKEIVRLLLEKGVNIEVKDTSGMTPLTTSCQRGRNETALLLLNHKALFEPEAQPGCLASFFQKTAPRQSALRVTCESPWRSDYILSILLARGADPSELLKHTPTLTDDQVQLFEDKESSFFLGCELFGGEAYDLHVSRGVDPHVTNKDGHSPLMIAIAHGNLPLIEYLILTLKHDLPLNVGDENINILLFAKQKNKPESRAWLWNHIVQDVKYIDLVRQSLLADPSVYSVLDRYERLISSLAVPKVKEVMDEVLLWFGRYRLLEDRPEHQSATCFVFKAEDQRLRDDSGAKKRVALKLMLRKDQFQREVEMRSQFNFEEAHVISVLTQHPSESSDVVSREDEIFLDPSQLVEGVPTKALAESMFAISLPLADRNLFVALKQERFAGKDWNMVKFILKDLVDAVSHVHSKGVIHADLKPLNLVRVNGNWKLIDFDACCRIGVDHTGLKSSSAFCPPESIYVDLSVSPALACVRSEEGRKANELEYDMLLAHPSFDVWGLGCICYMLCTDCRMLFQGGQDDNLKADESADSLFHLEEWSDALKTQKLSLVEDPQARNLLSLMLMKDPTKRPSLARILEHPFLTGKQVARMVGDKAEFDVFLSYRVWSDALHVEYIYDKLTAEGLKVWWDKKELKNGENWEEGFCNGLVKSRIFVPFLSKNALANFSTLQTSTPKCDNVLLEHRLALELKEMSLIESIFPIVLGDEVNGSEPTQLKIDWSCIFPVCPDVCVTSVEEGTCHHLHNQALGSPLQPNRTVLSVMTEMKKMQGALIDGEYVGRMTQACESIIRMVQTVEEEPLSPSKTPDDLSLFISLIQRQPVDILTEVMANIRDMIEIRK